MEEHEVEASPRAPVRVGGVLYLITIVVGIFNEAFANGRIVVPGDAMTTAEPNQDYLSIGEVDAKETTNQEALG